MFKGQLLNDRYEIKDTVGGGGMANVYLARDTILDRDVAIKALRMEYANDEEFIARFRREAHSATSLSHPNIVSIYDVGEEEDLYYMVMEYVDGMTLKKYIQTNGPVPVEKALDVMRQLTLAITHAHDNGIVHRDIKPQNILIHHNGQVKVTDFGIAMALSATSLTQTNSVLGSVHYLSPEQARGGMATKKSDIYSLGIVLFEMLTGRLPFSGQSAVSIALKHLQSETPSIKRWNPTVPQSVENVVLKATAKDPFHRYSQISELADDLETALSPERINEGKFLIPKEDDQEVTKAIPIITNDTFKNSPDETIVHKTDHGRPKKNKPKKRFTAWFLSILFVLIGAGIAALFILPKWLIPEDVEVADVTGLEYVEALNELSNMNLDVERETMYSETVPEGYIIKSDPEAGMTVKEGSTVILYSSLGKEKIEFGNYVGEKYSQIKALLEKDNYVVRSFTEHSDDIPEGEIIEQIQPAPGEKVIPENTTVIFQISLGPEAVILQSLEGKTIDQVSKYLEENGLSINIESREFSDDVQEGKIISQEPAAYKAVEKGTEINVVISKGPEEKPPITKTVSFTVELDPNSFFHDVKIYIKDLNHPDITRLYDQQFINKDTTFELDLIVPPNGTAQYQVLRDDQVYLDKVVPYEEEGEE